MVEIKERVKAQSETRVSPAAIQMLKQAFKTGITSENQLRKLNFDLKDEEYAADIVRSMIEVNPNLSKSAFKAYFADQLFVEFGVSNQKTYNLYDEKYERVVELLQSIFKNNF